MVIQGVIRPPPEIRAVADRTAKYVSKNGRSFEKKILGSEKGKAPKFAFLLETSPFHAYYEQKVQFYENGGEDEKEEAKEERKETSKQGKEKDKSSKKEKTTTRKASVMDPVTQSLLDQRSKISEFRKRASEKSEGGEATENEAPVRIPPPPPLHFVNIAPPASLTPVEVETVQLVAQFTALDGKGGSFLSQLSLREWRNPAFAFCQPRHAHFPYFTALVDAYRRIIDLWASTDGASDNMREMAESKLKCLEIATYRAEYERDELEQNQKAGKVGEADAQVDWHNFVVVETIDFPVDEVVEMSMLAPPPPPTQAVNKEPESTLVVPEDMETSDNEDEPIRVVPSYTPKVVSVEENNKMETVIDPITGKSVALKDMPEHLRIQLLDPKWAEQRKKFQDKQKDSNLVGGDVVASNLARLNKNDGKVRSSIE